MVGWQREMLGRAGFDECNQAARSQQRVLWELEPNRGFASECEAMLGTGFLVEWTS